MRPIAVTVRAAVVAVAMLLVGSAIADPASDKAAERQLRSAQAQVLATFRTSLAADARTFTAAVVALEKTAAANGPVAAQSLFDALVVLQTSVTSHVKDAANGQATAAKDVLAALTLGTEGLYPPALYPGDGTPTAAFEASVDGLLAKTYAKLRSRVAKTVRKVERAGTHVTVRIRPPRRPVRVWSSQLTDFVVLPAPTIDVLVAFSAAAATGDGKLRAAGQASTIDSDLIPLDDDVSAVAVFNGQSPEQRVTPANGRWSADFGNADFAEGVWLVLASQNLIPADASIGVR